MKLVDILSPQLVFPDILATNKEAALHEICVHIAQGRPGLQAEQIFDTLNEREKLGSTGIGEGVAIPHGKLNNIDKLIACFAKSTKGVEFASIDNEPTHLFFILLAPHHSAGLHLKALARISRLLKNQDFRLRLMNAQDPQVLFDIIQAEDAHC